MTYVPFFREHLRQSSCKKLLLLKLDAHAEKDPCGMTEDGLFLQTIPSEVSSAEFENEFAAQANHCHRRILSSIKFERA